MGSGNMKVSLAQLNFHTGYFSSNTNKIVKAIKEAKAAGSELAVFPELAISGYPPRDFLEFDHFVVLCEHCMKTIAEACEGITAIVGGPSQNPNEKGKPLYNAAYTMYDGQIQHLTYKNLLPTYDIFDENRYFQPGLNPSIVNINGWRIAITICEDLWSVGDNPLYINDPMAKLAKQQPDLVINIAASPFSQTHDESRKAVLRAHAKAHSLPIVYVNHIGAQTELIFDGGSCIMGGSGQIIHQLPYFEEEVTTYQVPEQDSKREPVSITDSAPGRFDRLFQAIKLGTIDYFRKLGFEKAIIGLSGGIDSGLTMALAAQALGPDNVLGVLMPSPYTSDASIEDATTLAENLGSPLKTIHIEELFNQYQSTLAPHFAGTKPGIAEENLQARSRAVCLMAISNKFGHILLNTSNKSEMAVGYSTLYGDMCGGLSLIGDVYKTEAFALSRYINDQLGPTIPENMITKAPSAELRHDQKDTDMLPPYEDLDPILYEYIENRKGPEEIIQLGHPEQTVRSALKMVNQSEYKRYQSPPILRVSDKAFGMGRRLPIVAKYLS